MENLQIENLTVLVLLFTFFYFNCSLMIFQVKEGVHVSCMQQVSAHLNSFKWPESDDVLLYQEDDVLCIVNPPLPYNRRGHYCLSEEDFNKANLLVTNHQ